MFLPNQKDAKHKAWLYRTLSAIYDDTFLADRLYFKGGTCAAMRNLLDRFSVDLDFDYMGEKEEFKIVRKRMENIFSELGLEIKDQSQKVPQYFLRYPTGQNQRNTLKIDISFPPPKTNKYEAVRVGEIDRIIYCQTIETMFANKLIALIERYERNKTIAGRDLYDIHYFFINNFRYSDEVIKERRQKKSIEFLRDLEKFINKKITQTVIDQDINTLVTPEKFQKIRKILKSETLMFIRDEITRLEDKK
ncbi:MAG TPA: nucleotidyl transferase AbiEii/AbiGii toxin family protein [Campylobacterales bacterium]|nr:nucleotidyl transferase AbiEii/AbiGii toxin family protein [Campylobacterales bacterium]